MTTPTPLELIAQAEELLKGTTPLPWSARIDGHPPRDRIIVAADGWVVIREEDYLRPSREGTNDEQNFAAIAGVMSMVPALLAAFRDVIEAGDEMRRVLNTQFRSTLPAIAKWDALTGKAKV